MKLNPDCIRDILIDIEDTTTINTAWKYDSHNPSKRCLITANLKLLIMHDTVTKQI